MTAAVYDIQIEQGETFAPVWEMLWPGTLQPFNFSGYSAHMQIRSSYYATGILADLHSNQGTIILGGVAGTLQPVLSASATAALSSGPVPISRTINGRPSYQLGQYDIKITDPNGNVSVIMGGNVWLVPQVTVGGS